MPLEEMDKLFGDESTDDDDDDDDDDIMSDPEAQSETETSSLVGSLRPGGSVSSTLTLSRRGSPMPARADNSLFGRMHDAFDGLMGRRPPRRDSVSRGRYNAIAADDNQ